MATPAAVEGWSILARVTTVHRHTVTKYRSNATGLTVLHVDVPGPIVHGFFVLATEALDDDGCPHTLEHLIFLGSEDYPYKGVLDRLANRALAQGTNAWTDVDHTCYTISTAGKEGFLNVFPVYLDHILYPTLTDSGCYTEVHHIDGDGNDAGVVYCEMQGRENSADSRIERQMLRDLYPEGCGYRSETGGMLANLRSLHVDTIRKYHRDYYRPDNLCCVVVGGIPEAELLGCLKKTEAKIVSKGAPPPMRRPWVTSPPIPPLERAVTTVVEFPEEEEDSPGQVNIAWRGPAYQAYEEREAVTVLLEYLTDSAVSLLRQTFCEIAEPLCSAVDSRFMVHTECAIVLQFTGVPTEHIHDIRPKLLALLAEHAEGDRLDMARMDLVLQRQMLRLAAEAELRPENAYLGELLGDVLYGPADASELPVALATIERLGGLRKRDRAYWTSLLKKYLVDRPYVCVEGVPSVQLAAQLEKEEAARIAKQRHDLGEARLKELAAELKRATDANSVDIPPSVLESFAIPSLQTIGMVPVVSSRGDTAVRAKLADDFPEIRLGLDLHFDHVPSAFVVLRMFINTSGIAREHRLWLPVLIDALFETAIQRPGAPVLSLQDVVRQLDVDTVAHNAAVGIPSSSGVFSAGPFAPWLQIVIKAEASRYAQAVQWLHDVLWHAAYDPERLKTVVAKLLHEVPEMKREGMAMTTLGMQLLAYDPHTSNHAPMSVLQQEVFLRAVAAALGVNVDAEDEGEGEGKGEREGEGEGDGNEEPPVAATAALTVADPVQALHALRQALCEPGRMVVQVVGDILAMPSPRKPWLDVFRDLQLTGLQRWAPAKRDPATMMSHAHLSELGKQPGNQVHVVTLPTIESSFAIHVARAPGSYVDDDVPALHVLGEYLSMNGWKARAQMEGLLWKNIRGLGLAYGASVSQNTDAAMLQFVVYRSPNAAAAAEQAKRIVADLAAGKIAFDEPDVAAAKCGVVYSAVHREDNMENAALQLLVNDVFKQTGADGTRKFLAAVERVTSSDLRRVLDKHLKHLFDPAHSLAVAVAAPGKAKAVAAGYRKLGYKVTEHAALEALTPWATGEARP